MPAQSPTSPPRWKSHIARGLFALAVIAFGYFGWRTYDARAARKEAEALGWGLAYTDPFDAARVSQKKASPR